MVVIAGMGDQYGGGGGYHPMPGGGAMVPHTSGRIGLDMEHQVHELRGEVTGMVNLLNQKEQVRCSPKRVPRTRKCWQSYSDTRNRTRWCVRRPSRVFGFLFIRLLDALTAMMTVMNDDQMSVSGIGDHATQNFLHHARITHDLQYLPKMSYFCIVFILRKHNFILHHQHYWRQ